MEIKTPASATLSPKQVSDIQDAVSHYRAVKGGVMPALHAVQGICGNWLPLEALKMIWPRAWIFPILTFTAS